jgi:hypothetical protein
MSSIKEDRAGDLARSVFNEIVMPLAEARRAAGRQAYFATAGSSGERSYFQAPILSVMSPADFEFPGGGSVDGMIDALAEKWIAEGETQLAAMAPRLKAIAAELKKDTAQGDGSVSALCYTMF